jgi:hypothetical protein
VDSFEKFLFPVCGFDPSSWQNTIGGHEITPYGGKKGSFSPSSARAGNDCFPSSRLRNILPQAWTNLPMSCLADGAQEPIFT